MGMEKVKCRGCGEKVLPEFNPKKDEGLHYHCPECGHPLIYNRNVDTR